jgi:hypothetical protein
MALARAELTGSPVAMAWTVDGNEFVRLLVEAALEDAAVGGHGMMTLDGLETGCRRTW